MTKPEKKPEVNNQIAMSRFGTIDEYHTGTSWKTYSQKLNFYFQANEITDDVKKRNIFLTVCGNSTFAIADALIKPESLENCSFVQIIEKLNQHFNPAPNLIVERFKFNKRDQKFNESIADYIAELRQLSDTCKFTDLDDRLRDRIVCGVRNEQLKHRLFEEGSSLTFKKALEMALASETAQQSVRDVKIFSDTSVLHTKEYKNIQKHNLTSKQNNCHVATKPETTSKQRSNLRCFRCGKEHLPDSCKHKSSKCNFCSKIGHLERACITKKFRSQKISKQANYCTDSSMNKPSVSQDLNLYYTYSAIPPMSIKVAIDGKEIKMEIDSGSGHSIISEKTSHFLWSDKPNLKPENLHLRTWTKEKLPILGSRDVEVTYQGKSSYLTVFVAAGTGPNLLGRSWFEALGIKLNIDTVCYFNTFVQKFPNLFHEGMGSFRGSPVTIALEENAKPIFLKHRSIPFALKDRVEKQIDIMVDQGILEHVNSSKWATPVVPVVKRNGEIRLCGDYAATVNKVLAKVAYPLPTANEIFSKLTGCSIFTKLDLENAYLQLSVDAESSDILTLNTTKGLYRVKKLPFGIASAPAIFQKFIDTLLSNLEGVAALLDDIIIGGKNKSEHDMRVEKVLERLSGAALKLNLEKCIFNIKSLTFLGFSIDSNGIHPTKEKVEAIHKAPVPKNKQELQAFLGLYNFYERFLPGKSSVLEPLHRLLDKNKKWSWEEIHTKAFQKAKMLLESNAVLTHFDPNKPIVLACDASPYGVGAVLAHITENGLEKPIAYGSKTLQSAERNYAQIDKEALSIIFGVKKFHQYLAGRKFLIVTDHKPLLGILRPHGQMPIMLSPRMMRWKLMLQTYDYDLQYRPGKKLGNADGLSRICLPTEESFIPDPAEILLLEESFQPPLTAKDISLATQHDKILSRVYYWILHGWPDDCPEEFLPYFRRKTELSVHKNCVLWGSRVVIPQKFRTHVLQILHSAHQGIVRTKAIARSYVWWPKIDQNIEATVNECTKCQLLRKDPPKAIPHSWIQSKNPWSRLHIDFAGPFKGKVFLILVDSYSKWPEVKILNSMSSSYVISALREIFSTHGLPDIIVSDNGSSFSSSEFKHFLDKNGIQHIFSPPYHPSSNGVAERMVQTVKQNLKRQDATDWNTKISRMLLALRTTPTSLGISPAEALMHRRPKTLLDRIHPDSFISVGKNDVQKKKHLTRTFEVNEKVFMKNYSSNIPDKWVPGIISTPTGSVTYEVKSDDGTLHKRHIDQLIKRCNDSHLTPDPVPDISTPEQSTVVQSPPVKESDGLSSPATSNPDLDLLKSPEPVSTAEITTTTSSLVPVQSNVSPVRKSARIRHKPKYLKDYVT